ncbi:MAG: MBL fold metallo-hydrolase [Chloroflexota bacterium]
MKLLEVAKGVYCLLGGSNVGLIVQDRRAVAVDTGLDKDSAREVTLALGKLGARLEAMVITHAHADHFGGASYLARQTGARVYASPLEAATVSNPILEPLFLFSGAAPPAELKHKFTLAKACAVDGTLSVGNADLNGPSVDVLPLWGHAPGQIGLAYGDTLFCADAFFPAEVLDKYKLPFCFDLDAALETLSGLAALPYSRFVPGHGRPPQDISALISLNREALVRARELILGFLRQPCQAQELLRDLARELGIELRDVPGFYLLNTSVHACLSSLCRLGLVKPHLVDNQLMWERLG